MPKDGLHGLKLVQGILWNYKFLFRIVCAVSWNKYCTYVEI